MYLCEQNIGLAYLRELEICYEYQNTDGSYGGYWDGGGQSTTGDSSGVGSGSCFLTTATVKALGLPDNCAELQVARKIRDEKMTSAADILIKDLYYTVAPTLVERKADWHDFYKDTIAPIMDLVVQDRYEDALKIYKYATAKLIDQHITYNDRDLIEKIFAARFNNLNLPYSVKYACIKA